MTFPLLENSNTASLAESLAALPYRAYVYGYPHKTAYRLFPEPIPLKDLWKAEPQQALSLYLHVPFCEYRCGFCNLFTEAQPAADWPSRYLQTLRKEARRVRDALPQAEFARIAIGGGTPTFLNERELAELLGILTDVMDASPCSVPVSCEASPATLSREKLELLRSSGVDRLSLGVQAFEDGTSKSLGRPQRRTEVEAALRMIRDEKFPILNIDLIYGGESQTLDDWRTTIQEALAWQPEELYLYPLYVRPLTGLGRRDRAWNDQRLAAYRAGRDLLRNAGYTQVSMRMFRSPAAPALGGPVYCCQEDGMVGLGCGARSYPSSVHYSTEYAVGRSGIASILSAYLRRDGEDFGRAYYGDRLPMDDQRRRYLLLSLLQCEGLSRTDYRERFGADLLDHFPHCRELEQNGLAALTPERIRLTDRGMELSDAIGPWFFSDRVRRLMDEYQLQ